MKTISRDTFITEMSPDNEPVESTTSGSTVVFESYDCFSNKITKESETFKDVGGENVNPATGPLYVEGAEPGDTLKVEIIDIRIEDRGIMTTLPGAGAFGPTIKEEKTKFIEVKNGKAIFNDKIEIPIEPMIGVIGTAPETDRVSTGVPGDHGANLDCKRITKGSTLYLPVNVRGGLLAMGDAHAVMSDGELLVCGMEIPAKTTVKVSVLKGQTYPLPFLTNDNTVMTLASADTVDESSLKAANNMQQFLIDQLGMNLTDASMLLSLVGDLRICQMVNETKTTRVEVPKSILDKYNYNLI